MGESLTNKPEISFIVPAHNEERELPATLRSIQRAAAGIAYEIVVADDSSTDATGALARDFGARVVSIQRRQIAAARNAGASAARGDILVFVDADTRITSAHPAGVRAALAAGCVGGATRIAITEEIPRWASMFMRLFATVYFGLNFGAGAFLFTTRENFQRVGGFDEKYYAGEEVYFSLALRKLGRFKILAAPAFTSGRKLRLYTGREVLRTSVTLLLGGERALLSRQKLALWYDDKARETA